MSEEDKAKRILTKTGYTTELEKHEVYFYIEKILQENKQLKQWDKNKDTRNSRQRIANYQLLKENKQLKEENIKLQMKYISVLDEIREYVDKYNLGKYDYSIPVFEIQEILDKVDIDPNDVSKMFENCTTLEPFLEHMDKVKE